MGYDEAEEMITDLGFKFSGFIYRKEIKLIGR